MTTNATETILGPRFAAVAGDGALALAELGLTPESAILDVGTGSGNFAIFLAMQGFRVLTGEPATDQSMYAGRDWESLAEKAGVRDRIRFESFDASALPFETGSFDAVFFFGVLHHIAEESRVDVLREALRVAKPSGGAVVFLEPKEEMLRRVRVDDSGHPEAADPSLYLRDAGMVREQRISGSLMDAFLYRR
jgi:ubiquinone/menaquinone biosynthesis C-methylase UbiE